MNSSKILGEFRFDFVEPKESTFSISISRWCCPKQLKVEAVVGEDELNHGLWRVLCGIHQLHHVECGLSRQQLRKSVQCALQKDTGICIMFLLLQDLKKIQMMLYTVKKDNNYILHIVFTCWLVAVIIMYI